MRRSLSIAVAVAALSCADPVPSVDTATIPAITPHDLDILFVIDNSVGMADEQTSLAQYFPSFMSVLQTIEGGLPNLHIGVISSNVGAAGMPSVPGCASQGDDGNLLVKAGCTGLSGQFISDVADAHGNRVKNYTGSIDNLFACMARLGTGGCVFGMHLEAAYRALQPGKNPNFYRPDAHLAIIVLADHDDCSTEIGAMFSDPMAGINSPLGPRTSFRCFEFGVICDGGSPRTVGTKTGCKPNPNSTYMYEVDKYVAFLKGLKTAPSLVIVAGIVGPDAPVVVDTGHGYPEVVRSCIRTDPNDPNDGAAPPIRIAAFLDGFVGRGTQESICESTLSVALGNIADLIRTAMDPPAPQPDAGTDGTNDGGGCCEAGDHATSGILVGCLLVALAVLPRRRRN